MENECKKVKAGEDRKEWEIIVMALRYSRPLCPLIVDQISWMLLDARGGARGGLGGYSPPSEHASPPSEGEKRFCRRFLAFIVP